MKIIGKKSILSVIWLVFLPAALIAKGPGTSGASFLKIDLNPRPAAMGGAFCGIANDLSAIQYNPAGTAQLLYKEIGASHNQWIDDVKSEFLGYVHPGKYFCFGGTLNYLTVGDISKRDINGEDIGSFTGNDSAITFNISGRLNRDLYLGFNIKALRELVDSRSAMAYAGDIGLLYKTAFGNLGLAIQNLGSKINLYEEAFDLPLNIKAGFGCNPVKNLLLAIDLNKPNDNALNCRLGGEYWFIDALAFRTGFRLSPEKNTGSGLTVGIGFKDPRHPNYQLDYSFIPMGDLGNAHRLSLDIRIGNIPIPAAVEEAAAEDDL